MTTIPTKSLNNGFEMPSLAMGLWRQSYKQGITAVEDFAERAAIEFGLENGITAFDTAPLYGEGNSERVLGEALSKVERDDVFVISKLWITEMTKEKGLASLEKSLELLQIDKLDLLLLHYYPKPPTTLAEASEALDACMAAGLTKHVGVANFGVRAMKEIAELTSSPIVYNQVHYNVKVREPEAVGLSEYAVDNNVLLGAWRPLEYGNLAKSEFLADIGAKYSMTAAQVALSWLLSKQNVTTLFKSNSPQNIADNIAAASFNLDAADLANIDTHFPDQLDISNTQPLTNGDVMKDFD